MKLLSLLLFSCFSVLAANGQDRLRIANNGEKATENEFPYQVALRVKTRNQYGRNSIKLVCGGALISKSHVLTAAHCIEPFISRQDYGTFKNLLVEVGSIHLGSGKSYGVSRASYHKGYTTDPTRFFPNDIAVIHLTEPVKLSDKVAIINLPKAHSELPTDTKVIASGFGTHDAKIDYESPILKKMDAKTIPTAQCTRALQQYLQVVPTIESNKMCAVKGVGYGVCRGDSGGPLVDSTRKTIVGVVSGGDAQCSAGTPDVYTKVSHFISYINEELNYDSSNPTSSSGNPAMNLKNANNMQFPSGYPQLQLPENVDHNDWYLPNFEYPQFIYPPLTVHPGSFIPLPLHPIYVEQLPIVALYPGLQQIAYKNSKK